MAGHVRKRGDKWYYSFEAASINGSRKRIERVGGRTKKEAEAALRIALQEYDNAGQHFEPTSMSVSDYLDYWYSNYCLVNLRHNTQASYNNIINRHIKPVVGHYLLRNLTPSILQQFINDKYLHGFSRSLLQDIKSVLNTALSMAVLPYEFIKSSPMVYVKLPRMDKSRSEINRVVQTTDSMIQVFELNPRGSTFYMPLMIGYHTGMRIGEILGLTESDIDLENKTISISKILSYQNKRWVYAQPKTDSSIRTINIGSELIDALLWNRKWKSENMAKYGAYYTYYCIENGIIRPCPLEQSSFEPVCVKENGQIITHNTMKYLSRKLNYGHGIEYNNHSLRHTHATLLLENGANPKAVQDRLGHSKIDTTLNVYAHPTKKMEDEAIKIIDSCLPTQKTNVGKS